MEPGSGLDIPRVLGGRERGKSILSGFSFCLEIDNGDGCPQCSCKQGPWIVLFTWLEWELAVVACVWCQHTGGWDRGTAVMVNHGCQLDWFWNFNDEICHWAHLCETFLNLLFKVGRRILTMAAPSSASPDNVRGKWFYSLLHCLGVSMVNPLLCCCGHCCTSWLTSASSGFQGRLKINSSPGILQAWGTRSRLLGHTASWNSYGLLRFSSMQMAIVGLYNLCCVYSHRLYLPVL